MDAWLSLCGDRDMTRVSLATRGRDEADRQTDDFIRQQTDSRFNLPVGVKLSLTSITNSRFYL